MTSRPYTCLLLLPAIACILLSLSSTHGGGTRLDVVHAVSGAIGSALSITILYPLETVRTRLQVDALSPSSGGNDDARHSSLRLVCDIVKAEGLGGLYRGWFSLVVALMALNFVYFYCFLASKRWIVEMLEEAGSAIDLMRSDGDMGSINPSAVDLMAGYLAGAVAVLVTGPLWLVNTRLKLQGVCTGGSNQGTSQQYTGILHCLRKVYNDEGISALWQGTFTSIILALNPAIQLGVYEALKRNHLILGVIEDKIGIGDESLGPFVNSFLAKFIATVVTYPIQVLQTRHRAGIQNDGISMSQKSVIRQLYRGFEAKVLQTCLNTGIIQ
ncbi:hypothetical protein ACHAXA_001093 [Cyclostephanos tholiformis]|uniref:Uncharacterized protein n=1 Tax=Cyclostephanos tholiformis TaxID=382380 RepID=A0ABD3REG3_9STRA